MGRPTKGLDRCATADRSSAVVEQVRRHGHHLLKKPLKPAKLRAPRRSHPPGPRPPRRNSVFDRGLAWLHTQVVRGVRLWRRLWLVPDPLPNLSPTLQTTRKPTFYTQ